MTYAETVTENGGEMNEKDEDQHETVEGRATDGRWMDTVRDRIHRVSGHSLSHASALEYHGSATIKGEHLDTEPVDLRQTPGPLTSEKSELKWWTSCTKRHLGVAATTPPASREPHRQLPAREMEPNAISSTPPSTTSTSSITTVEDMDLSTHSTSQSKGHNLTTRHPGTFEKTMTEDDWHTVHTLRPKKNSKREKGNRSKRDPKKRQRKLDRELDEEGGQAPASSRG
ncbi:hypothetical protein HPB51_012780 [Rhipicephalus microplus]|uniref:Uncharacterized protein n=1 Tax=Rhipicephalus microplus TaxID=6941 RepID=A0A9J6E9X3_RHIMP|nr:hypothetical protein HPB51_012780 [Rhipicephalus microplus]